MIVIRRRTLVLLAAAILAAAALALPGTREALGAAGEWFADPVTIADAPALAAQRELAERGIERAYERGVDQLKRTRELRLPISDQQAAAIQARYLEQLRQLRRGALASLGDALGVKGVEQARYVAETETKLENGVAPDEGGVLLAPSIAGIVGRVNDLVGAIADAGTREMAAAPSPSPGPSASPRR